MARAPARPTLRLPLKRDLSHGLPAGSAANGSFPVSADTLAPSRKAAPARCRACRGGGSTRCEPCGRHRLAERSAWLADEVTNRAVQTGGACPDDPLGVDGRHADGH